MAEIQTLRSSNDIDAMLERSKEEAVVLLKHSNSCPISSAGFRQFQELSDNFAVFKA